MKFKGSLANKELYDVLGLIEMWILYHNSGRVNRAELYRKIEPIINPFFDVDEKRDRNIWNKRLGGLETTMRNNGYLQRPDQSGRGLLTITDKGRERIEALNTGHPDPVSGITLADLRQNLNFPDDAGNIPTPLTQPIVPEPEPEPEPIDPSANNLLLSYLAKKGYQFSQFQVATFYAALKTKGFVILSGLSGTGKTKLAQHFGELFGDDCVWFESVRPDWRDSKNLLGFVNPLLDNKYQSTGLLRFVLRARDNAPSADAKATPHFLILDEMNLAHVEYYFAEFLSVLESGRITQDENLGFTREAIHLHSSDAPVQDANSNLQIPNALRLPPNLYIIGTVNVDETTFAFSPKVLDRAFTIEFRDADLENYDPNLADEDEADQIAKNIQPDLFDDFTRGGNFIAHDKGDVALALDELGEHKNALIGLNKSLAPFDLHFGYRVLDEIALFFVNAHLARSSGIIRFDSGDAILDAAVLMKVLPKMHGSRQKLEEPLTRILRWTLEQQNGEDVLKLLGGEGTQKSDIPALLERWDTLADKFVYPATAKKVLRMLHTLYSTGFASFS